MTMYNRQNTPSMKKNGKPVALLGLAALLLNLVAVKSNTLNIHIIPHSHMETGYLDTVENAYNHYAQGIFTSVIGYLSFNQGKTFTCSELFYFKQWWEQQTSGTKNQVRKLINEGRLEFVSGGLVNSDEACPTYNALIDNFSVGRDFLYEEFGIVPKVAWQIDQYGHSAVTAEMLASMGYEAFILSRISDSRQEERKANKDLEFMWSPEFVNEKGQLVSQKSIFTSILYDHYYPPFVELQNNKNKDHFSTLKEKVKEHIKENVISELLPYFFEMSTAYKTSNVMMLMGDTFSYFDAAANFEVIDLIIENTKAANYNISISYSTVSKYLESVQKEVDSKYIKWSEYTGDFYPFYTADKKYYTGYFSTRQHFKGLVRHYEQVSYSASNTFALETLKGGDSSTNYLSQTQQIFKIQSQMSGHKAVTGTITDAVKKESIQQMMKSLQKTQSSMSDILTEYALKLGIDIQVLNMCEYKVDHRRQCPQKSLSLFSGHEEFLILVHNPSLYPQRIPPLNAGIPNYSVKIWNQGVLNFEDVSAESFCYKNYFYHHQCDIQIDSMVDGLGIILLEVREVDSKSFKHEVNSWYAYTQNSIIGNDYVSLQYIEKTEEEAVKFRYTQKGDGFSTTDQISEEFLFSFREYQSSGAFNFTGGHSIFHTENPDSLPYQHYIDEIYIFKGKIVSQFLIEYRSRKPSIVESFYEPWERYHLKIKIFKSKIQDDLIEFDVEVGKMSLLDKVSKELTINFQPLAINQTYGVFYTDSNGLKMIQRRTQADRKEIPKIGSNMYPVNSAIMVDDTRKDIQMIVMNDRSQAGSAYKDRRIEFIINRQLLTHDDDGINEALVEVDEKGERLLTYNTYFLKFTNSKQKALKIIQDTYVKRMAPVGMYQATKFAKKAQSKIDTSYQNQLSQSNILFSQTLFNKGIRHHLFILQKHQNPSTVMFLGRFLMEREGIELDGGEIAQAICRYADLEQSETCGKLNMFGTKVTLDGLEDETDEGLIQTFRFEFVQKAANTDSPSTSPEEKIIDFITN